MRSLRSPGSPRGPAIALRALVLAAPILVVAIFSTISHARAASSTIVPTTPCSTRASASVSIHRAGLVVTFGDRHSAMYCIEFSEESITGLQLLQRSGLPLVVTSSSMGSAICSIGGEGSSDPTDCFKYCKSADCHYWAYYQRSGDGWRFSQIGSSSRVVHDGDIDGWAYGPGGVSNGAKPEAPPAGLCPDPVPPTPVPADTTTPPPEARPNADRPAHPSSPTRAAASVSDGPSATAPPVAQPSPDASASPWPLTPTETIAASTQPSGVLITTDEGAAHAARSLDDPSTASGGGSRRNLIMFAVVACALVAAAGGVAYRRRWHD